MQEKNIIYSDSGGLVITSTDGCAASTSVGSFNAAASLSGWSAIHICEAVGQATVAIGGLMTNASYLAEAMGDTDWIKACDSGMLPGLPLKLYGVTCAVDTSTSIEMRNITLTLLDS